MTNQGSGNLGTCEQNCRKMHTFNNKNNNLLSLKDLSIGKDIHKLDGVVDSLKIEGRLKSKKYLFSSIKYYQSILENREDLEMFDLMQIAFNRKYTKGRMFNENGIELANPDRVNNSGLYVGDIIKYDSKYLTISLNKTLHRLDNIRLICNKEFGQVVEKILIDNTEKEMAFNQVVQIENKHNINSLGKVYIVKTRAYEDRIKQLEKEYYNKINIILNVEVKYDKVLKIECNDKVYLSDFIVEKAKNAKMSKEDIKEQLQKTNNTPFNFEINIIGDDDIFIPKSLLNNFKRNIIKDLISSRTEKNILEKSKILLDVTDSKSVFKDYTFMIRTYEQARALKECGVKEVYVNNIEILSEVNTMFDKVIPVLPRVIKDQFFNKYIESVNNYDRVMVSELGMLEFLKDKELETNYSFNIANKYSLALLKEYNVKNAITSIEYNGSLKIAGIDTTRIVYGYMPLMIMDYCPINNKKNDECGSCQLCQNKQYYLYDENNSKLPLVYMNDNILELYSSNPINNINQKNMNYGILMFSIENYEETMGIVKKLT